MVFISSFICFLYPYICTLVWLLYMSSYKVVKPILCGHQSFSNVSPFIYITTFTNCDIASRILCLHCSSAPEIESCFRNRTVVLIFFVETLLVFLCVNLLHTFAFSKVNGLDWTDFPSCLEKRGCVVGSVVWYDQTSWASVVAGFDLLYKYDDFVERHCNTFFWLYELYDMAIRLSISICACSSIVFILSYMVCGFVLNALFLYASNVHLLSKNSLEKR